MSEQELSIIQIGLFHPIIESLRDRPELDSILRKSGLHVYDLDNLEGHVPAMNLYQFFHELDTQLNIDELMNSFTKVIELASLKNFWELVGYAPDLNTAIQFAIKYNPILLSHERYELKVEGNKALMRSEFVDEAHPGRDHVIAIAVALLVKGFQIALPKGWVPDHIYMQGSVCPDLAYLLPDFDPENVTLNHAFSGFWFETRYLGYSMLEGGARMAEEEVKAKLPLGLAHTIYEVLDSNKSLPPTLKYVASLCNLSERTLRRRLSEEGTTFKEILKNWRFKSSMELLQSTESTVDNISNQLGYANTPNFIRAFKTWTQVTPEDFRRSVA